MTHSIQRFASLFTFLFVCLCIGPLTHNLYAQDQIQKQLQEQDPIWYNSDNDSWQRSSGQSKQEKKSTDSSTASTGDSSWIMGVFHILIYIFIAVLIIGLLVILVPKLMNSDDVVRTENRAAETPAVIIQDLPFQQQQHNTSDPYTLLETAQLEKKWNEVITHLYVILLLELHQSHIIHIRPGKTNRGYINEATKLSSEHRQMMTEVVSAFEHTFFGHHHVSEEQALYSGESVEHIRAYLKNNTNNTDKNTREQHA